MKRARARVLILYTGGTVGMRRADPAVPSSPLVPADGHGLLSAVPRLGEEEGIAWEFRGATDADGVPLPPVDSCDVGPRHWIGLACAIERAYHDFDGFVILHGTDTLAYTASALSFLLENLGKPVVLTGSQLPLGFPRTDAVLNLVNSLHIAGHKAVGLPLVPEVAVCFGERLFRGNRTRKVSASAWQGFASPNYPPLGTIGEHIRIDENVVLPLPGAGHGPLRAWKTLVTEVADVGLFPGIEATHLAALLGIGSLRGLVLRTFGAGNAPSTPALLDVIARAARGADGPPKAVVSVTQCLEGAVEPGRYAASGGLLSAGVVSGSDMTPEAALTKLMWLLAAAPPDELRARLQMNHRGEQGEGRHDDCSGHFGGCA